MADNRSPWPTPLTLVLLMPVAVLITVLIWVIEIGMCVARYGYEGLGFVVVWEWRDTVTSIVAYVLLVGALFIRRAARRADQI